MASKKTKTTAVKTFAELEKQEKPSATNVLETLCNYTTGGWAINPEVVFQVIVRAGLSRKELVTARGYLQTGYDLQMQRSEEITAREYETARQDVDRLIVDRLLKS